MQQRTIVITGANTGIGLETAVSLASSGERVIIACRNPTKADAAVAEISARAASSDVSAVPLDLASLASVRACAAELGRRCERIDVLINNAGLIQSGRETTVDGFETTFGVNHLGHFLLTDLLRDRLVASAPARVVVVSSFAHRWAVGGLSRTDLQTTRSFRGFSAYGRSKLANALFALELARRLDGTGVTVNAVHPGSINSHFGGDGDTGVLGWFIKVFGGIVLRSPEAGARTSVLLASSTDPKVASATGGYWSHGRRWRPSRQARDVEQARWLWEESERLVASAS